MSNPPIQQGREDPLAAEKARLLKIQKQNQAAAIQIAKEAASVMMELGWKWDATLEEYTTDEGVKRVRSKLILRTMELDEWQLLQKELLRRSLT